MGMRILYVIIAIVIGNSLFAQDSGGFIFGVKGGSTLGFQTRNGSQPQSPLFGYNGSFFLETLPQNNKYSLYAELGYHMRGNMVKYQGYLNDNGTYYPGSRYKHVFNNVALSLGAKQFFASGNNFWYYLLGIRGEYTVGTRLDLFTAWDEGLRRINYGVDLGGGFKFPISELVGGLIEFKLSPDFSRQVYLPPIKIGYRLPDGTTAPLAEQNIRNISLELTVGFYFIRKVEYVD